MVSEIPAHPMLSNVTGVLILVVMEDGLRVYSVEQLFYQVPVLILVVMEDGLRE